MIDYLEHQNIIKELTNIVSRNDIIMPDDDEIHSLLIEKRGNYISKCICALTPTSTKQVSEIIKICNKYNQQVVVIGGNTGLVGGAVSNDKQILLSTKKLERNIDINPEHKTITVGAGVTQKQVIELADKHNFIFPIQLPSQDKCTIGGNIITNAGGLNTIYYGTMYNVILGSTIVMPNGEIIEDLNQCYKRNIGTSLTHMMIASEGTMGIITKAVIKIFPKLRNITYVDIGVKDIETAVNIAQKIAHEFTNEVRCLELMNENIINLAPQAITTSSDTKWHIIIQMHYNLPYSIMNPYIQDFIENKLPGHNQYSINNAITPIWKLRYKLHDLQKQKFFISIKHDLGLPLGNISKFLQDIQLIIQKEYPFLQILVFGHLGDGNLHFNLVSEGNKIKEKDLQIIVKDLIINKVIEYDGTFSAEHGVGKVNKKYMHMYHMPLYQHMNKIKLAIDKNNLLNPVKSHNI